MNIGDRVKYTHNNQYDANSYMTLYQNTGTVTRVAEKHGEEYVEVHFDNPIYKDDPNGESKHYFCFAKHLSIIKEYRHQEALNENHFEETNDYLDGTMNI